MIHLKRMLAGLLLVGLTAGGALGLLKYPVVLQVIVPAFMVVGAAYVVGYCAQQAWEVWRGR